MMMMKSTLTPESPVVSWPMSSCVAYLASWCPVWSLPTHASTVVHRGTPINHCTTRAVFCPDAPGNVPLSQHVSIASRTPAHTNQPTLTAPTTNFSPDLWVNPRLLYSALSQACWTSLQSDRKLRGPHVARQQRLSNDICCGLAPTSAAAAVDWRDRDGQTDARPFYDAYRKLRGSRDKLLVSTMLK